MTKHIERNGAVKYTGGIDYGYYDFIDEQDDRNRRAKRQELFTNHLLKIGMIMLCSFFGVAAVLLVLVQIVNWFNG